MSRARSMPDLCRRLSEATFPMGDGWQEDDMRR